ncbi:bifunctional 2-polyprenyl-6-hydroxyphenol methylase/3-demethylubiquinol 3-O-methyltransferase UbiG [Nocardia sp. BMG51109]|uniref:class I SAM-dependent methyltransferase n=1 Tax=Nocardia sp. BMG51109 TaxID=1056816 RepID=UPI0004676C39|nr:class I SAM-dependent methyltransferase [Nocardia sp. BMG51109]
MTKAEFAYTGCDNLEVMAGAVNYNRFLVDIVGRRVMSPDVRVLDFGAGAGTYADLLSERHIVPDCVEPDHDLRKALRSKGYRVVDLDTEPSGTGQYEVVYSFNVLEHIKDDRAAARRLASCLRSGGTLVVYVPAFEMLYTSMDAKVGHHRRYRRRRLDAMLREAGLRVVESRYCDPIGFFATLAYKFLGRSDGTINCRALKLYDRAVFPVSKVLQIVTGKLFGKNVLVVAVKPRLAGEATSDRS